MKIISTHDFKYTLKDIHKNTENRKFCFILGAGASRNSGIPTGGELAKKWFDEIRDRIEPLNFEKWAEEQKIDKNNLAASYGPLYRKRFENDKNSGYEFLVQAMKDAKPCFGHIVLAQILSRTFGHCVITTNFDSLIESSVYQFTDKTPLVCGHESLSGYARPSQTHPLIIKIHRDLLLEPKSDPNEISELDAGWKEPLDHIFSTHIPIVLGYGGNDGSLMTYFENMNKPSNFFWCGLNGETVSDKIKLLIEKHSGSFVTIDGFDEFMHDLLWVFDEIKPINEELNDFTSKRIQIVNNQLDNIIKAKSKKVKISKTKTATKNEISAFEYSKLAEKESDLEKRKEIYLKALEKYPTTGWLWWEFTYFMHYTKKDFLDLDNYYQNALKYNMYEAAFISTYATFLNDIKNDPIKAEEYFMKSLVVDPKDDVVNANYAIFLKSRKKDLKNAEKHYLIALEKEPEDEIFNGNYAQLLFELGRLKEGEACLNKALDNCSDNSLLLELLFYRYAHFPTFSVTAENKIEELLGKGIRSSDWDFSGNIERAIKDNHPNIEKLKSLALRISEDTDHLKS